MDLSSNGGHDQECLCALLTFSRGWCIFWSLLILSILDNEHFGHFGMIEKIPLDHVAHKEIIKDKCYLYT